MRLIVTESDAIGGIKVYIEDIGTVLITATDEGIVSDIFAVDDESESVASARATHNELNSEVWEDN